ncbi:MAG TPA: LysM peptidoglycan-binding domain-containing protein [Bacteroidales bacterium]|nr:LysM peptidoglycan-binding domain-containing protein [Bacteroidales bacterium]
MRHFLITILFILFSFSAFAQLHAFRNKVAGGYNFMLYTPAVNPSHPDTSMPLIIFLHGHSLAGSDLNLVRRYGVIDAIEKGCYVPAMVLAPQCPQGTSWSPERVLKVLDWVQAHYAVDSNRVYVVGMSLGGYGTMDFVGTYPERVTAAAAICGGGNKKLACNLSQVPLWVMHGTADRAVPISESIKMVEAMAACGDTSRLIFTKYPGFDHGDLARVFYTENLYLWLLSHDKCDTTRKVVRTFPISSSSLKNVYSNIRGVNLTVTQDYGNDTLAVNPEKPKNTVKEPPATNTTSSYHTIKKGDTLYAIARKNHTTVEKLCKLNKIVETKVLQPGMKIRVN